MNRELVALSLVLAWASTAGAADVPFDLVDGDRVVLIGGTLIERDQSYGYLETRLTRRFPDRNVTFRNLGWSGDTVEGVSRAGFGSPGEGFKPLVDHVLATRPTVLIIGYGPVESFEGAAGLPKFREGLDRLLKAVEPTKARLVFLGPPRQEDLGRPLPDPTAHNADLALYRDAIRDEADKRGARFVDLFDLRADPAKGEPRLTDNGIHFNAYGYFRMAETVESALSPIPKPIHPDTPPDHPLLFSQVAVELGTIPGGRRLRDYRFATLPPPPPPDRTPDLPLGGYRFRLDDLDPGRYIMRVDGRAVASGTADDWAVGIVIRKGSEFDQVEALRSAINAKNQLYFYRWRPQNETYLFGFRKHEQGQNAAEIPKFDPLVEAKEAEIARLRKPVPHTYELTREGEAKP